MLHYFRLSGDADGRADAVAKGACHGQARDVLVSQPDALGAHGDALEAVCANAALQAPQPR